MRTRYNITAIILIILSIVRASSWLKEGIPTDENVGVLDAGAFLILAALITFIVLLIVNKFYNIIKKYERD